MEHPKVIEEPQKRSNEGAIRLLNEWMADESGYDEKVWPVLKQDIEEKKALLKTLGIRSSRPP